MIKSTKFAIAGVLVCSTAAIAQFSVVDVAAVPNWATHLAHDIQVINNTLATVTRLETIKQNFQYQWQYLQGTGSRWSWISHPWRNAVYEDSTGLNAGWLNSINTGLNTASAYANIVSPVNPAIGSYPAPFVPSAQLAMARVERLDGQARQSTSAIGYYTAANSSYQQRVSNLAGSMYSGLPADNTAAALANQANAALMLQLEAESMQGELQKQQLAQNTELMIMQREREAADLNSNAHFYSTVGVLTANQGPVQPIRIP